LGKVIQKKPLLFAGWAMELFLWCCNMADLEKQRCLSCICVFTTKSAYSLIIIDVHLASPFNWCKSLFAPIPNFTESYESCSVTCNESLGDLLLSVRDACFLSPVTLYWPRSAHSRKALLGVSSFRIYVDAVWTIIKAVTRVF